ncbi:MAG: accessory factor UbiK family protein [Alphaproteobacteria bacterium]
MAAPNRVFEDAARVAGGAMGTLAGVKREVETLVRHQLDRLLAGMDLVTREEFDAVKEMAAKARTENEQLEARLAALEGAQAKPAARKSGTAAKPGSKKGAKKAD